VKVGAEAPATPARRIQRATNGVPCGKMETSSKSWGTCLHKAKQECIKSKAKEWTV